MSKGTGYAAAGAITAQDLHEDKGLPAVIITQMWHILYLLTCPLRLVWHSIDIYILGCMRAYLAKGFENAWLPLRTVLVHLFCARTDGRFLDRSFPPEKALGKVDGVNPDDVEWKRLSDIIGVGSEPKLISGKLEAADIVQGGVGDCWLLAAISALAEYKGVLQNVFVTKQYSPIGKYTVRLFHARLGKWVLITIDDFVPVKKGTTQPIFAKPNGPEMWVCLLEKAFAKYAGSYGAIDGGFALWAMEALTGDRCFRFDNIPEAGRWRKLRMVHAESANDTRRVHFEQTDEFRDSDEMFDIVTEFDRIKSVMTASSKQNGNSSMVAGHAYTLIGAYRVRPTLMEKVAAAAGVTGRTHTIRLVKMRNPWKSFEWSGDWSDSSPLWQQHKDVAKAVGFTPAEDGVFWLSWEDFCQQMRSIDVNKRSVGMRDLALDMREDMGFFGPLVGCTWGFLRYWFCRGPMTMLASAPSDDDTVETAFCECCLQHTPYKCVYRV